MEQEHLIYKKVSDFPLQLWNSAAAQLYKNKTKTTLKKF